MRQIKLLRIVIRNFRSYVKEDFTLPENNGLILLIGENKTQKLGSNGSGKSSFLKAIQWCIYGDGRTSDLLAWGAAQIEVTTFWEVDSVSHSIRRYGPPSKIELDGMASTQEKIDALLGLDKIRFLNSVIFGQSVPLFPDLSIGERGELLDQVLSLNIWQVAANNATQMHTLLETNLNEKKVKLAFLKGKIESITTDEDIQQEIDRWNYNKEYAISNLEKERLQWNRNLLKQLEQSVIASNMWQEDMNANIASLQKDEETWKQDIVGKAEQQIQEIYDLEANLSALIFDVENNPIGSPGLLAILEKQQTELLQQCDNKSVIITQATFELDSCDKAVLLWNEDKCPQCQQVISASKKKHELSCIEKVKISLKDSIETKKKEYETSLAKLQSCSSQIMELRLSAAREQEIVKNKKTEIEKVKQAISDAEELASKYVKQVEEVNPYTSQIAHLKKQQNPYIRYRSDLEVAVNPHIAQIERKEKEVNPFYENLTKVKTERKRLIDDQTNIQNEYNNIESEMMAAHYWRNGFKRIRLYFIQQVLAALEIEIQAAINALGLDGWKIRLATETTTKSETVKLGVQISISSPIALGEWTIWSGGETQRLRRAIAMGLSSLIQRAAGVFYPLEVWDEPTAGLSPEGVEDLLSTLQYRAEASGKQIWVVDHSALTYAGFSEIWSAIKDSEGSRIEKLTESEG